MEKTTETWPALIVEATYDGMHIRIVGTALLRPGRYNLVRVDERDKDWGTKKARI